MIRRRDCCRWADFTRYESGHLLTWGGPFQEGPQAIAAVVVALEEWLRADHDARLAGSEKSMGDVREDLGELPRLRHRAASTTMDARIVSDATLAGETPNISRIPDGRRLVVTADALQEDEPEYDGAHHRCNRKLTCSR